MGAPRKLIRFLRSDASNAAADRNRATREEQRQKSAAYLVLQDTGQIFVGSFGHGRASEAARNIGGAVVALPVIEDYRNTDQRED